MGEEHRSEDLPTTSRTEEEHLWEHLPDALVIGILQKLNSSYLEGRNVSRKWRRCSRYVDKLQLQCGGALSPEEECSDPDEENFLPYMATPGDDVLVPEILNSSECLTELKLVNDCALSFYQGLPKIDFRFLKERLSSLVVIFSKGTDQFLVEPTWWQLGTLLLRLLFTSPESTMIQYSSAKQLRHALRYQIPLLFAPEALPSFSRLKYLKIQFPDSTVLVGTDLDPHAPLFSSLQELEVQNPPMRVLGLFRNLVKLRLHCNKQFLLLTTVLHFPKLIQAEVKLLRSRGRVVFQAPQMQSLVCGGDFGSSLVIEAERLEKLTITSPMDLTLPKIPGSLQDVQVVYRNRTTPWTTSHSLVAISLLDLFRALSLHRTNRIRLQLNPFLGYESSLDWGVVFVRPVPAVDFLSSIWPRELTIHFNLLMYLNWIDTPAGFYVTGLKRLTLIMPKPTACFSNLVTEDVDLAVPDKTLKIVGSLLTRLTELEQLELEGEYVLEFYKCFTDRFPGLVTGLHIHKCTYEYYKKPIGTLLACSDSLRRMNNLSIYVRFIKDLNNWKLRFERLKVLTILDASKDDEADVSKFASPSRIPTLEKIVIESEHGQSFSENFRIAMSPSVKIVYTARDLEAACWSCTNKSYGWEGDFVWGGKGSPSIHDSTSS